MLLKTSNPKQLVELTALRKPNRFANETLHWKVERVGRGLQPRESLGGAPVGMASVLASTSWRFKSCGRTFHHQRRGLVEFERQEFAVADRLRGGRFSAGLWCAPRCSPL